MKKVISLLFIVGTGVFAQIGPTKDAQSQPSASLNVMNDCGAKGNGSADDSPAIQRCINQASSGQTIYFPNGVYNLGSTLYTKGSVTYLGQSTDAVLHAGRTGIVIFMFPWTSVNNVTISTLTFEGGSINTNGDGEMPTHMRITNCKFQNLTQSAGNWTQQNYIFADNGLSQSQIDHNSFSNLLANGLTILNGNIDYDGDIPRSAIFAYGLDNTSIDHNSFDHIYQGIKVCQVHPFQAENAYIGWNTMTHIHRMGMEIQDAHGCGRPTPSGVYMNSKNFVIENNTLDTWDNHYWGSFGISFANVYSDGTIVRNNTLTSGEAYNGNGSPMSWPGIGIEVGGRPAQVSNNTIKGPWGAAIAVFSGSTGSEVHHNYACNVDKGASAPTISDEGNPSPTDTYYHDNTTAYPCN